MAFQPYGLITTPVLRGAYLEASNPRRRESATVPFWENFLNNYIASKYIAVNSQQPPDDTTKAVDVVVKYYDNNFNPIIAVLLECKRHGSRSKGKTKSFSELEDMESQLQGYLLFLFESDGGLAKRPLVYGAVAYGTRIRVWRAAHENRYINIAPMWGGSGTTDLNSYRDPGVDNETKDISGFLKALKTDIGNDMYVSINQASSGITPYSVPSSAHTAPSAKTAGYQVLYTASTSKAPAPMPGYQTAYPGPSGSQAQSSGYYAQTPRDQAPTSSYQPPALDSPVEEDEMSEDGNNLETLQTSIKHQYRIVSVKVVPHMFAPDKFIFNDKKGKTRSTRRTDWRPVEYGGKKGWKHSRYITFDKVF